MKLFVSFLLLTASAFAAEDQVSHPYLRKRSDDAVGGNANVMVLDPRTISVKTDGTNSGGVQVPVIQPQTDSYQQQVKTEAFADAGQQQQQATQQEIMGPQPTQLQVNQQLTLVQPQAQTLKGTYQTETQQQQASGLAQSGLQQQQQMNGVAQPQTSQQQEPVHPQVQQLQAAHYPELTQSHHVQTVPHQQIPQQQQFVQEVAQQQVVPSFAQQDQQQLAQTHGFSQQPSPAQWQQQAVQPQTLGQQQEPIQHTPFQTQPQQHQKSQEYSGPTKRRRKFVSYTSSEWELLWLNNVDTWEKEKKICEVLNTEQAHYIHDFLKMLCSSFVAAPYDSWCVINDDFMPLWYNAGNQDSLEIAWDRPSSIPKEVLVTPPKPVTPGPEHSRIASKFVFLDEESGEEFVEYIEPLVSHLRFPLSKCLVPPTEELKYHDTLFRGWIIPPPPVLRGNRAIYVDAGASSWDKGFGGPSLKYFTNTWKRHGVIFDETYAFEMQTPAEKFYQTLPQEYHSIVHYRQCAVSSSPKEDSKEHPFLPLFINRGTHVNDYVLFKLDIDSGSVEAGNIDFILNDRDTHIDEVVWEHHVSGNYLMYEHWKDMSDQLSLRQSYEYFLKMREKGIRAHSWV
jgi:hypothetical protein